MLKFTSQSKKIVDKFIKTKNLRKYLNLDHELSERNSIPVRKIYIEICFVICVSYCSHEFNQQIYGI